MTVTAPAPAPSPPRRDVERAGPRSRRLKRWLIADTIATVILAPLAVFWGMMSVMASTTTSDVQWANTYAWINLSLPLAMVGCLVAAWIAWAIRRHAFAWLLMFLPLAWVVASIAMMANAPN